MPTRCSRRPAQGRSSPSRASDRGTVHAQPSPPARYSRCARSPIAGALSHRPDRHRRDRARRGHRSRRRRAAHRAAAASTSSRSAERRRAAPAPPTRAHRRQARRSPAARRPRAQPRRRQLGVGDDDRGARLGHPARVGGLVVGRRVRVGDEDRRAPVRGDLEDRAAGARDAQVAGQQRLAEGRDVLAQVVVAGGRGRAARAAPRSRASPQACRTRKSAPASACDRRLVDRARAQRAAEDEHAGVVVGAGRSARARRRGRSPAAAPGGR